jgi:hypothetical protein
VSSGIPGEQDQSAAGEVLQTATMLAFSTPSLNKLSAGRSIAKSSYKSSRSIVVQAHPEHLEVARREVRMP